MAGILKVDKYQDFNGNDIMTSDGAGNITINNAALKNTPAFEAYRSGTVQAVSSGGYVKIQLNTEAYDTDNCYDNSTNYRFTPTSAGKYLFYAQVAFDTLNDGGIIWCSVYKNGSELWSDSTAISHNGSGNSNGIRFTISADANGTTDYFELYGRHNFGSDRNTTLGRNIFGGYKLIGA